MERAVPLVLPLQIPSIEIFTDATAPAAMPETVEEQKEVDQVPEMVGMERRGSVTRAASSLSTNSSVSSGYASVFQKKMQSPFDDSLVEKFRKISSARKQVSPSKVHSVHSSD